MEEESRRSPRQLARELTRLVTGSGTGSSFVEARARATTTWGEGAATRLVAMAAPGLPHVGSRS